VLLVGSAVAFVVAIAAIKFFINYVSRYGFRAFGWYRIIVGVVILVCLACGIDLKMA
jgi:undecaprenyl-diphosphatase